MEKTVLGFFLSIPVKRGSIRHSETSPLPQLAIQLCSTLVICQEGWGGAVSVEHFGPGVNAIHIESIVILYQKEIKEIKGTFFFGWATTNSTGGLSCVCRVSFCLHVTRFLLTLVFLLLLLFLVFLFFY
jgi:hypothetical protein